MLDKIVVALMGLLIGFASFVAVGTATSVVMSQVQGRTTPQAGSAPAGSAQVQAKPDPVMR